MKIFDTLDLFTQINKDNKKTERILTAIKNSKILSKNVTYSVGDTLTWIRREGNDWLDINTDELIASRRYQTLFYVNKGTVDFQYNQTNCLISKNNYDDLCDRQNFMGQTQKAVAKEGNLVWIEINEAHKIIPSEDFQGVFLRVTIE